MVSPVDRREEFNNKLWSQGYLLSTKVTLSWSISQRLQADQFEKRRVYVDFSERDEGKSRTLVYVCETAIECPLLIKRHNSWVELMNYARRLQLHPYQAEIIEDLSKTSAMISTFLNKGFGK